MIVSYWLPHMAKTERKQIQSLNASMFSQDPGLIAMEEKIYLTFMLNGAVDIAYVIFCLFR